MRKGRDGGKNGGKKRGEKTGGKKEKRLSEIVATTSLPAVDRRNADRWNAARSRQKHISWLIDHSEQSVGSPIEGGHSIMEVILPFLAQSPS